MKLFKNLKKNITRNNIKIVLKYKIMKCTVVILSLNKNVLSKIILLNRSSKDASSAYSNTHPIFDILFQPTIKAI